MAESTATRRPARTRGATPDGDGGDRQGSAGKVRARVPQAVEEPTQAVADTRDAAEEEVRARTPSSSESGSGSVREEITTIVREAALEVLKPVARRATLQAAKYAITQGPRLANEKVAPRLRDAVGDAGGLGSAARRAAGALPERGRSAVESSPLGSLTRGRTSSDRLPLQMSIDIAAPSDVTYEELADRLADMKAFCRGDIVDEEHGSRIDWEGEGQPAATAAITVHRIADDLTRVMVSYEAGTGGVRGALTGGLLVGRNLRADLRRLKADLEMGFEDEDDDQDEADAAEDRREDESPRGEQTRGGQTRGRRSREDEAPDDDRDTDRDADADAKDPDEGPRAQQSDADARSEADEEDSGDDAGGPQDDEPQARRQPVRRRSPARTRQPSQPRDKTRR